MPRHITAHTSEGGYAHASVEAWEARYNEPVVIEPITAVVTYGQIEAQFASDAVAAAVEKVRAESVAALKL